MSHEQAHQWRARPLLASGLRWVLLTVPLVVSMGSVYLLGQLLPPGSGRTWWGLLLLFSAAIAIAVVVERGTRRLMPIALLLKLSMIFPDRAPSRLRLARTAAFGPPRDELLWHGAQVRPTSTSEVVLNLVTALGTHDRRTRGHSERVRLLCDMLAAELKLDEDARDRLRWAALLHDVGKMDTPAAILNKPAALTAAEFDRIKEHPAAGAVLVSPLLPWLGEWGEGILDHHERYDGAGYPNGKAGEQISTAGRIIGVVDAFETMTAARPYKKAVAHRTAREELARCAGTHFDPVFVRAFLSISVPRVLWAMGPVSFVVQLPFVQPIAQTGLASGAGVPQAAAAFAAGAAGAAALATGGVGSAYDDVSSLRDRPLAATAPRLAQEPDQDQPRSPAALPNAVAPAGATPPPATSAAVAPAAPDAPAAVRSTSAPRQQPAPKAASSPAAAGPVAADPEQPDRTIISGPVSPSRSRTATFELVDEADRRWECQLQGNAAGGGSTWEPCSGTFTVSVVRDGNHVLRVRDTETREQVDAWQWTVDSAGDRKGPAAVPMAR